MNLPHPSSVLRKEWIELIRSNAAKAEQDKRLTKEQINLIYSQEWYKMLVPSIYGGMQKPYPEFLELVEALAWADGSMGWVTGLRTCFGWTGGFMEPDTAKKLFSDGKFALSYCRAATGTAEVLGNGKYKVNGTWQHSSGIEDATHVIANCIITQNGTPALDENNKVRISSFLFNKSDVKVIPTWKSIGMLATSSDGFEIKNVVVTEDKAFVPGQNPKVKNSLYAFPLHQFIEAMLAVNLSGMTMHFVDLCEGYFEQKKGIEGELLSKDRVVQGNLGRLMRKFEVAREKLFYGVSILWESCKDHKPLYPSVLNKVSAATANLSQISREIINDLYPFCGLAVTDVNSEFNRVWRDFHTASQHTLLVFGGWASDV